MIIQVLRGSQDATDPHEIRIDCYYDKKCSQLLEICMYVYTYIHTQAITVKKKTQNPFYILNTLNDKIDIIKEKSR